MKILFATPECAPYAKTGGLGDVGAALPAALAAMGHDVRVLLPCYAGMELGGESAEAAILSAQGGWPAARLLSTKAANGVTLLLLDCPSYYQRAGGPYVDSKGRDYADNALRFGFLSRTAAALGTAASPCTGWQADVVHANDWPCALAPLYLAQARTPDVPTQVAASVMTIHNLAFQGVFSMDLADALGIPVDWRGTEGVEYWGQVSMLKAGLQFADAITTVSPTYAREIQTDALGHGLAGLLRSRSGKLTGILNGIDTQVWNPATDSLIPHRYTAADLSGKALNKAALQRRCGLAADANAMLFGVVSRLTSQKGIDLVLGGLDSLLAPGAQLVVLGQGEPGVQDALLAAAERFPARVCATAGFDERLAHQIEAGADAFLMPSRFEPCGLNQMYSQAYGTVPIVTATGGLADTVIDATAQPQDGTGFVMASQDHAGFHEACSRALQAWREPGRWREIQANAMARSFGWEQSAAGYVEVYQRAIAATGKPGRF